MKVVAFHENLPVDRADCLVDIELTPSEAHGHDVTVRAGARVPRGGLVLIDDPGGPLDAGCLRSTLGEHLGAINTVVLRRAHALLESGRARGRIVLQEF